jgi:hypothetical protein
MVPTNLTVYPFLVNKNWLSFNKLSSLPTSGRHDLSYVPKSIRPLAHPTWLIPANNKLAVVNV